MPTETAKTAPDSVDVHAGNRVRVRRMYLGMSQTQLGTRMKVTFQQIQKYEKGVNRMGASRLQQAARALKVPVAYFFEGLSDADSPATDGLTESMTLMASAEGARLTKAFTRITDVRQRRAIAVLAESLASPADAVV